MSKRIDQIKDVVDEIEQELNRILVKPGDFISVTDLRDITTKAFANVAKKYGVLESTIRDKCTRQIDADTDTFFNEVMDNITGGHKLIDRMHKYACSNYDDNIINNM